jgi:hypothetical protein
VSETEAPQQPRCRAITFAGQPGHLLVRCRLAEGHKKDHRPTFREEDSND